MSNTEYDARLLEAEAIPAASEPVTARPAPDLEDVLCELDSLRALLGLLGDLDSRRQAEAGSDAGKVFYSLYYAVGHTAQTLRNIIDDAVAHGRAG